MAPQTAQTIADITKLETLINEHDVVFFIDGFEGE
jgi:hypothetical protein